MAIAPTSEAVAGLTGKLMGNSNSGRGGLDPGRRAEIERLLAVRPALEKKAIARQVGVAPSTIHRHVERLKRAVRRPAPPVEPQRAMVRCSGCGGLVFVLELPCRICQVRTREHRKRARLRRLRARRSARAASESPPDKKRVV